MNNDWNKDHENDGFVPESEMPMQEAPREAQDPPQWDGAQAHSQPTPPPQATSQWEPRQDAPQPGWNSDERRTPYQAPVRSGEEIQPHAAEGEPTFTAPSSGYSTYEEWQRQNSGKQPPQEKKPKGKRLWLKITGGVVAACLIFAIGTFAGSLIDGVPQDDAGITTTPVNPNAPSLDISNKPVIGSDNYDAQDGMAGEDIYKKVSPSVVSITATSLTAQSGATGSGVIMTQDGYIITNAHVVSGADKVTVLLADSSQYSAQVIGEDTKTDLAVLKIEADQALTAAEFGNSDELQAGEYAYAIGSPGGVELATSITGGRISAINRDITIDDRVMTLIQTDASINPGNSGGALINKYGQVVGITSAKLGISYYEGLGFAIPINSAKEIVDQLLEYGFVPGRPSIGVTGGDLSEQTAQYNDVPQGVLITSVDSRSDAAKQGLQAKDIIIGVNGKTVKTMDEVNAEKEKMKAGDKITLRVYRLGTGKEMNIEITLADENDLASASPEEEQAQQQQEQQQNGGSYFFQWP